MKLNFKICSPFFILLMLVLVSACSKRNVSKQYVSALSTKDSILLVKNTQKASYFQKKQVYDSAFYYFDQCRVLRILAKDTVGEAYSLISMAGIQKLSGDYFGSEENATEALMLLKNSGDKNYLSSVYNLLGICYRKLLNYNMSVKNYEMAEKIAADSLTKCIIINNIASVYTDKKEYNRAYTLLNKLIASDVVVNHPETHARVLNNLGNVCSAINKPYTLNYLINGLAIRTKINDNNGIVSSNLQLANFYTDKKKERAIQYAQKAYAMATNLKIADERLAALKILIAISPQKEFARQFITISDSLYDARLKSKTEFASIKYDAKNAETENLKLKSRDAKNKLQAQNDKTSKIMLGLAIAIIVLLAFFIIYIQRLKHKKDRMAEVYKTENRISKKIHDELASDVFETMMFTETLDFDTADKKEILLKRLDNVYEKTREISRENNSVATGTNFYVALIEMLARYKSQTINVLPANAETVNWDEMDEHKKTTIYRVIQEFMVNMKKHSQATLVVIKFNVLDKNLHINYADNGVGIKKNIFFYKNGLQNADIRIKSVNGTITFDEAIKGLKILIVIPL